MSFWFYLGYESGDIQSTLVQYSYLFSEDISLLNDRQPMYHVLATGFILGVPQSCGVSLSLGSNYIKGFYPPHV